MCVGAPGMSALNCAGFFVAGLITLLVAASADGVSTLELAHVCVGDCDSDGAVHINELIVGVNIALGVTSVSACPAFECPQYVSGVFINCAVQAVDNALLGCRPATIIPSATATPCAHFRRNRLSETISSGRWRR